MYAVCERKSRLKSFGVYPTVNVCFAPERSENADFEINENRIKRVSLYARDTQDASRNYRDDDDYAGARFAIS